MPSQAGLLLYALGSLVMASGCNSFLSMGMQMQMQLMLWFLGGTWLFYCGQRLVLKKEKVPLPVQIISVVGLPTTVAFWSWVFPPLALLFASILWTTASFLLTLCALVSFLHPKEKVADWA